MAKLIKFNDVTAVALAMSANWDGFWLLRLAGTETSVNAITARLVAREHREKKYETDVSIAQSEGDKPIAALKGQFKILKSKLNGVYLDAILCHTDMMAMSDNRDGFRIASFSPGRPRGFFSRLDNSLTISLKREWEDELWNYGLETWKKPNSKWYSDAKVPIALIDDSDSFGVNHYHVHTTTEYADAWKNIIRKIIGVPEQWPD